MVDLPFSMSIGDGRPQLGMERFRLSSPAPRLLLHQRVGRQFYGFFFNAQTQAQTSTLEVLNRFQVSLHGKVIIANHMVASSLYYVLTLVALDFCKLQLQQILVSFVWGKIDHHVRHQVSQHILTLPKHKGRLGLIDITMQAMAL